MCALNPEDSTEENSIKFDDSKETQKTKKRPKNDGNTKRICIDPSRSIYEMIFLGVRKESTLFLAWGYTAWTTRGVLVYPHGSVRQERNMPNGNAVGVFFFHGSHFWCGLLTLWWRVEKKTTTANADSKFVRQLHLSRCAIVTQLLSSGAFF